MMLIHEVKKMFGSAPSQKSDFSSTTRPTVADSEARMRVITIAGENKGAYMELASPTSLLHSKKRLEMGAPHHRLQQLEENAQENSNENGNKKEKNKEKGANSTKAPPMATFANSNIQGVNNSIVLNSSCTHSDPGIHLTLSRKPSLANGYRLNDHTNGHQT